MKKSHNIKGIILAAVMLLLIVGYYYYLSNRNVSQAEDADRELQTLTATQEVLTRDLETNYPPTPREVIKYFSQITQCFYNEDNTEEEIEQLGTYNRVKVCQINISSFYFHYLTASGLI